jgi:hypothetical protein
MYEYVDANVKCSSLGNWKFSVVFINDRKDM